jgi:hypothetical protein
MEKTREDNQKVGKIGQVISQMSTPWPKMIKLKQDGPQIPCRKHAGKRMMVQTLRNGILKLNHLLSDELFKGFFARFKVFLHLPFIGGTY